MRGIHRTFFPELEAYVAGAQAEAGEIPQERRAVLEHLSEYLRVRSGSAEPSRLVFICTHNSRRSQMAQIWAQIAALTHCVPGVETYSGGTEATAFNPRAVAALERAGFHIAGSGPEENPVIEVRYSADALPMECFSKIFSRSPNPSTDFCAVMTCSAADESCPLVVGASKRVAIPYDDPKAFDGTSRETAAYDERCRQIAREMLYVFAVASAEAGGR